MKKREASNYWVYSLLVGLTGGLLLVAIAGACAGHINPERNSFFVWLSLILPFVLVANAIAGLYWLCRWRWWALMPLAALLINFPFFSATFQFSAAEDNRTPDLKIISYNVHGFHQLEWGTYETAVEMADYFRKAQIDILCMQEFEVTADYPLDSMKKAFSDWPHVFIGRETALFSRFPITAAQKIDFENSNNSAVWATLDVAGTPVHLMNAHLQTTGVAPVTRELAAQSRGKLSEIETKLMEQIGSDLRYNAVIRATQVDQLHTLMDSVSGPMIVCGDFNDTPASYTYRAMRGKLKDGFRERGVGYGATFRGLKSILRIDYIFYNEDLSCISYQVPDEPYSDHRPVIAELAFTAHEQK